MCVCVEQNVKECDWSVAAVFAIARAHPIQTQNLVHRTSAAMEPEGLTKKPVRSITQTKATKSVCGSLSSPAQWYHAKMSRDEAEKFLAGATAPSLAKQRNRAMTVAKQQCAH